MRTASLAPFLVVVACLQPPSIVHSHLVATEVSGCEPDPSEVSTAAACVASGSLASCVGGGGCDADDDGIPDALERAMATEYAPAFAFNSGKKAAVREPAWPASAEHFVSHANLTWRGDGKPAAVLSTNFSLGALGAIGADVDGKLVRGDDPSDGAGPDFWLCMTDTSDEARVTDEHHMLAIPDGIDVVTVVRPANGTLADSRHFAISYVLLFAYNPFDLVGNHEGDWEGITVFVEKDSGKVAAAWFERHGTTDNGRLITVEEHAPVAGSDGFSGHALRFWDLDGARHHVVAFVAQGSHAMYDAPGETRIYPPGPLDAHAGDDLKLLTWSGRLVENWASEAGWELRINFVFPGEANHITLDWARFRGQWGCQNGPIGASWPGPFGNARHPRPMFEARWGSEVLEDPTLKDD